MSGTIQKTISLLDKAVKGLGAELPLMELERLGIMVNEAMSVQARSFHTPEHIFDLADGVNPLLTLAAVFHDIVYYQIDEEFTPEIKKTLKPYINVRKGKVFIKDTIPAGERCAQVTLEVFGFSPGQELSPYGGMNEFLSALVMNKKLVGTVPPFHLVKATACIEATIPFRGTNSEGKTAAEVLADRLNAMNEKYAFGMSSDHIVEIVQTAVSFANKDVENFGEKEVARFLDNTWKLLPETNPALRTKGIYTINNYRIALQKMEGFLCLLKPENVFAQYRGVPSAKKLKELNTRAERNVLAAREYLGIKLLTTGVLEAIATLSGGDAPISLFMGDIRRTNGAKRFEDLLPQVSASGAKGVRSTIHNLLAVGRAGTSDFDLKNSPLANYLYLSLGGSDYKSRLASAREMFDGKLKPDEFLNGFSTEIIVPVIEACAEMAITRRKALLEYKETRA